MRKTEYKIIEEDGLIIYDESDDLDLGEMHILDDFDELDIEYLLRETARQEAQQAKERRTQRWISTAVILSVVSFIAIVSYINLRGIL